MIKDNNDFLLINVLHRLEKNLCKRLLQEDLLESRNQLQLHIELLEFKIIAEREKNIKNRSIKILGLDKVVAI